LGQTMVGGETVIAELDRDMLRRTAVRE
jgi:hypothetical protein